jgi:hypothetical protein
MQDGEDNDPDVWPVEPFMELRQGIQGLPKVGIPT